MPETAIRPFRPDDAAWLVRQHRETYSREEGFDDRFGDLVARIVAEYIDTHDPACEAGWIAQAGAVRLGSIFCVRLDARTAKLRLFQLAPEARGQGLGRRLLAECVAFARGCGYDRMQLSTHESHRAAGRLYARAGFRVTASHATRSFGQDVVEQTWDIDL